MARENRSRGFYDIKIWNALTLIRKYQNINYPAYPKYFKKIKNLGQFLGSNKDV